MSKWPFQVGGSLSRSKTNITPYCIGILVSFLKYTTALAKRLVALFGNAVPPVFVEKSSLSGAACGADALVPLIDITVDGAHIYVLR